MTDNMAELARKIAELEAQLHALRQAEAAPTTTAPAGTTTVSGTLRGNAVGVNYGTVQAFFGTAPGELAELLLTDYLDSLIGECQELRLYRLTGRRQTGAEQRAAPLLRLQAVYTNLTTDGSPVVVHERQRTAARLQRLLKRLKLDACLPDTCAPELVREPRIVVSEARKPQGSFKLGAIDTRSQAELVAALEQAHPDTLLTLQLTRPELALAAIHTNPRLVLLGEPGFGKTTCCAT